MAYSWQSDIIRPDGENGTEVLDGQGVYQPQLEGGDNITIEDGRINASGTLENVQANFAETNPSDPSYIKNKPDLSIYATASGMETELAGKQDVISDLETIRSGSESGATAVQPGDLAAVATTGSYTSLSNTPQNIVQDANYVHSDNNFTNADKSKLDGIASGAEVNIQSDWLEADSSSDAFIKNKPTIPAAQQNADWNASSGVTAILNKPDLSAYATDSELTSGLATKQNVISDLDTIRAGAAAGATAAQPSDLPSSDELVPSASSGDAGKVLTVDSQGEPQWVTPSGGTTYSAGDGVDISAQNVISADVDGTTIGIDSSTKKIKSLQTIPTKTSDLQNDSNFVVASSLATVATSGSYADLSNKPSIPSVDQAYNASSTNPQSGTAVAQAIASIPSSSYTAGNAIDITNNEISVNYDTETLTTVHSTATVSVMEMGGRNYCLLPAEIQALAASGSSPSTVVLHIPPNTLKFTGDVSSATLRLTFGASDFDPYEYEGDYSQFTSVAVSGTYDNKGYTFIDEQDIEITVPCNSLNGWSSALVPTKFTIAFDENEANPYANIIANGSGEVFASPGLVFSYMDPNSQQLAVRHPLPASTSGDAGKVLTVDSQGEPGWQTPASVTVDQTYNASSTNAQSGTAVAQAIASIPAPSVDEVPAVTSSDDGKVLTAAYSGGTGSYSWQPASGGGSYTAGTAIGINNDAISVLYDGYTMATMYPTHDYFVFRVSSSGTSLAHFATPDSIKTVLTTGYQLTHPVYSFKVKILDGQLLYFSGNYTSQNCRLCFGTDMSFSSRAYYTSSNISMTYDSSSNRTYIDAQEITISPIYNQVGYINTGWSSLNWSSSSSPDYFTFMLGDEVSPSSYVTSTSSSIPYAQFTSANGTDSAQLYTKGIRGTTSIFDIAVVDALPEYPINTTLYLIPET